MVTFTDFILQYKKATVLIYYIKFAYIPTGRLKTTPNFTNYGKNRIFVIMKRNEARHMRSLPVVAALLFLAACASMGRPTGGDYDIEPPYYVQSNPAIGSKGVKTNKITVDFNENIQVEDVMTKVVVSPAQKSIPPITANGKRLTVELRDTMLPNTTYTIDFSDAIKDLNEGNILDGFAIDFATGDSIDSLRISGMVFEARTLEPAQGMLVGVYSNPSDTAITTLPMERIAKTNQLGQFTIRGLKPGDYRIFAINDINRDYHWDRSEDIAFYDVTISPYAERSSHRDTIYTTEGIDTIVDHEVTSFYPNDILLTWFNEGYQPQYLKDYSRPDRKRLLFNFSTASDTLPEITIINGVDSGRPIDSWTRLNTVATLDTLEYFITDTALMAQDTMMLEVKYLRTDTLDMLTWTTDTLRVLFKGAKEEARQKEEAAKKAEKRRKKAEKNGENIDSIEAAEAAKLTFLNINARSGNTQEVYAPLLFETDQPVETILQNGLHMEIMRDTIWDTIAAPPLERVDSFNLMRYKLNMKWAPGVKYRYSVDSASVISIYNQWNSPFKHEFTVRKLEDYSSLFFNITGVRDSAVVEILDKSDKPVATAPLIDGVASFPHLQSGTFYARLYIDRNGNGEYDTGNLHDSIQPEEVYYFPKKLVLKKNWDVEQSWDIYETAIDLQKPKEIVKNKPKEKKRRNKDGSYIDEDGRTRYDDEEDDGYDDGNFFGPSNSNGTRNLGNGMNNGFGNLRNNRF